MDDLECLPEWLDKLLQIRFFEKCAAHANLWSNLKNIYCPSCCASMCCHDAATHNFHPLLEVERYNDLDVVSKDDIEQLIDCTNIQTYTTNNAIAISLKSEWFNTAPATGISDTLNETTTTCSNCPTIVQTPSTHCSQACLAYAKTGAMLINLKPKETEYVALPGITCVQCPTVIQMPSVYCSLACKVDDLRGREISVKSILLDVDASKLTFFMNLMMAGHGNEAPKVSLFDKRNAGQDGGGSSASS